MHGKKELCGDGIFFFPKKVDNEKNGKNKNCILRVARSKDVFIFYVILKILKNFSKSKGAVPGNKKQKIKHGTDLI